MGYRNGSSLNAVKRNQSNHRWTPKMPLVEICGRSRVLIENHLGVLAYGVEEIQINVSIGTICIRGHELNIKRICKEKLVISGIINGVDYQGRR